MVIIGSGNLLVSRHRNVIKKERMDNALAKRSKRVALKKVRYATPSFGPFVSLGKAINFEINFTEHE